MCVACQNRQYWRRHGLRSAPVSRALEREVRWAKTQVLESSTQHHRRPVRFSNDMPTPMQQSCGPGADVGSICHLTTARIPRHLPRIVGGRVTSMCAESVWDIPGGGDYGAFLARDFGLSPLYLRYNSGLAIPDNGGDLARLLRVAGGRLAGTDAGDPPAGLQHGRAGGAVITRVAKGCAGCPACGAYLRGDAPSGRPVRTHRARGREGRVGRPRSVCAPGRPSWATCEATASRTSATPTCATRTGCDGDARLSLRDRAPGPAAAEHPALHTSPALALDRSPARHGLRRCDGPDVPSRTSEAARRTWDFRAARGTSRSSQAWATWRSRDLDVYRQIREWCEEDE